MASGAGHSHGGGAAASSMSVIGDSAKGDSRGDGGLETTIEAGAGAAD